ncbi:MAG: hypothetical protein H6977_17925 [Gammaproteobacteria bacterium]|nr:hypothetical protein [Gammaproteobacteria bacterium]MCP5201878.1 hypothetical protein [Gammaproteobacteria bacterium]
MPRSTSVRAFLCLSLLTAAPLAPAESVPTWATDTSASASVFTGTPDPVRKTVTGETASQVDVLFASAESYAGPGYASAYSTARGSVDPLFYQTHSAARADAELNGLEAGRYRVSFLYVVLSAGPGDLYGNSAAVGYQYGSTMVELEGTGGGLYTADIQLADDVPGIGSWIAFFAWSNSYAALGEAGGNASLSDVEVVRLPDQPVLPAPLPASIVLGTSALALLTGRRRRQPG